MPIESTAEALEKLEASKQSILTFVDGLPVDEITTESSDTVWNIKDHVAHLAAYTQTIQALLEHRPRWEAVGMQKDDWQQWQLDDINAYIYHKRKNYSWEQARQEFVHAHDAVANHVQAVRFETLQEPITTLHPDGSWLNDTRTILKLIESNVMEHYADHLVWMHETQHEFE